MAISLQKMRRWSWAGCWNPETAQPFALNWGASRDEAGSTLGKGPENSGEKAVGSENLWPHCYQMSEGC